MLLLKEFIKKAFHGFGFGMGMGISYLSINMISNNKKKISDKPNKITE